MEFHRVLSSDQYLLIYTWVSQVISLENNAYISNAMQITTSCIYL